MYMRCVNEDYDIIQYTMHCVTKAYQVAQKMSHWTKCNFSTTDTHFNQNLGFIAEGVFNNP